MQDGVDLLGDRHFHAHLAAQLKRRRRGLHTLGNHVHAVDDVLESGATAKLDANPSIAAQGAGTGQHQVTEARQPHQRRGYRAACYGEGAELLQAAGDERSTRVGTEAEAIGDASGDGDDVLQRAAMFDADEVAVAVGAQAPAAQAALHAGGGGQVRTGQRYSCGMTLCQLHSKRGPGKRQ